MWTAQQILRFLLANPNYTAHVILALIGFIFLVASGGAAELLAAGVFIVLTAIVFFLFFYKVLKNKTVRAVLSFILYIGDLGVEAAVIAIRSGGHEANTFWVVWAVIALLLTLGGGSGTFRSLANFGGDTRTDTVKVTQRGVASVAQVVLDEGELSVIYNRENKDPAWNFTSYRIVYGPGKFPTKPTEWCHNFNWTHPWGGGRWTGYPVVGHVLSTLEDHIFAKMDGLRTTDNKAIYLDVYIFFRLVNVDKLVKTHVDPIFAFRGVAREDIFRFVATKKLDEFVRVRRNLCDLNLFPSLLKYAESIGFVITRIVCIDYKDKPRTWKLSNQSDKNTERKQQHAQLAAFRAKRNEDYAEKSN